MGKSRNSINIDSNIVISLQNLYVNTEVTNITSQNVHGCVSVVNNSNAPVPPKD